MALETKLIKLGLDGRWNLEDLSITTKNYIQLYGFAYSLIPELSLDRQNDIDYIYGKFPWRGGFSTVNFFNDLFHKIPREQRPEVRQIQYACPGFIELNELAEVAFFVGVIVKSVCYSGKQVHDLYRSIQKESINLKLSKINLTNEELKLTERQIEFCKSNSKALEDIFGLTEEQSTLFDKKVRGNQAMKLKILLSVFRRVEPLAEKQSEGMLDIFVDDSNEN